MTKVPFQSIPLKPNDSLVTENTVLISPWVNGALGWKDHLIKVYDIIALVSDVQGLKHIYLELEPDIFDIPEAPTTAEVETYVNTVVAAKDKNLAFLFYKRPSDIGEDYTYVWVLFSNGKVFNIKEIVAGVGVADYLLKVTSPVTEPTLTGNVTNLNRVVEGLTSGQRWFIDQLGRGTNFNKTAGDIEITEIGKGYISKSSDGETWKTTTLPDGSLFTQKL